MTDPTPHLVGFGRLLRTRGLPVGTGRVLTFCRAAAALAPLDRDSLYWAGRAALVSRPEDLAAYDDAFRSYFGSSAFEETMSPLLSEATRARTPETEWFEEELFGSLGVDADEPEDIRVPVIASSTEVLRKKDFARLTDAERERAFDAIRRLAVVIPKRTTRRLRLAPSGDRFDLRRTVRAAFRTEGEPFERRWRQRAVQSRPLVLLLDVSGSMESYARPLLQFGYAAAGAGRRVEVFCFGTRLTRVSRTLRTANPDAALERAAAEVRDWSGGTRIGDSLAALLRSHGATSDLRRAIVVICSDGLERGNPDLLAAQMARLNRLAHLIVWVNPLKGDPRYEPLARGMSAALPYVDRFLPGHNLDSLAALVEVIAA